MSLAAHLEALGRAHGFTREQLEANRRGELHPSQRGRGLRRGRVAVVAWAMLCVLALAGGLGGALRFRQSLGDPPSSSDANAVVLIALAGALLALGCLAAAVSAWRRRRRRRAAFLAGRLQVVEGPMDAIRIVGRGGMPGRHLFRVGGHHVDVRAPLWALLTQGATYRLYLVDGELLSFEPVPPDALERAEYERELAHAGRTQGIRPSGLVR